MSYGMSIINVRTNLLIGYKGGRRILSSLLTPIQNSSNLNAPFVCLEKSFGCRGRSK
jgi:hypothetical protein